jgi:hypothetical protein
MSPWITIYSWSMAVIYPALNAAILIAALSAARHPAFRREFHFLAVAAALSVFCSLITLLLRLHLTFSFSFLTVGARRALLPLHDIAEVASIVFYCVGFITLARRIRSLPHATGVG